MANGLTIDVPAAIQRGLQLRQQEQQAPMQAQQNQLALQRQQQQLTTGGLQQQALQQQIDQRSDEQKNLSFVNSALRLKDIPDAQKLDALLQQKAGLAPGADSADTDAGILLAQQGNFAELNQGIDNIISQGERQGIIKAAPVKNLSSLQQKVAAEGLDPFTPQGQARAREITQGSRTDPSLKPSDQQILNKANEGQLASASFAVRVQSANENLTALENTPGFDPTSIQTAIFEALPGGNLALSENEQRYAQSKRDFITAILRKESGAAIGKDEFANEDKKFFPQVGDKPAVLKQKSLGRKRTFENLRNQSKGVFDVQNKSNTGALSKAEQSELAQLRAELGQQ